MISKIPHIKSLAVFRDFEWDKAVLNPEGRPMVFDKLNVLYGRNYSGKTTLSRIIRALETGEISDKYDEPTFSVSFDDGTEISQSQLSNCRIPIRVFNEDFVRVNLGFINNPDQEIAPFAVLGDNNNLIEQEIASLNNQLGSHEEGKESGLYAQLNADKKVYGEIKTAHEQVAAGLNKQLTTKATDRKVGIKYKFETFGDPNYNITKLLADVETVMSTKYVPPDDKSKSTYVELLAERLKPDITPLPPLTFQWDYICNEAEHLLSQEIGTSDKIAELVRDAALNEWVKKGCELHEGTRTNCAFCGSTIEEKRWEDLYKHFDDESRLLEGRIDELLKGIEKERQSIQQGFMVEKSWFYSKFQDEVEQIMRSYTEDAHLYVDQLCLVEKQLVARKKYITSSMTFERPSDHVQALLRIRTSYEALRIQSNDFSGALSKEQQHARRELLLLEVYQFCMIINYEQVQLDIRRMMEELTTAENVLATKEAEIIAIEDKIKEKKRQLNDEEKGALRVNDFLMHFFGHEFLSLRAIHDDDEREKKVRFEVVRDGKRAYHLSEGECSLIAFCYFIAKLDDVDTSGKSPIIWIDDPISSLDGNHIFFVYSLIASEIAKKGSFEQLFVSTHNLDFLKYLKRLNSYELQTGGKLRSVGKQYFIIERSGPLSTLRQMPKYLKEYGTEFNYLFSCIYKCSLVSEADDDNYELFYNFGNNARKFLEIYLYFKYPDYAENKLERFFGEESVPPIFLERINNEYSHLNGTIERASMPVVVPEMVSTAKLIIERIKEDRDQYTALLNSIGVSEGI